MGHHFYSALVATLLHRPLAFEDWSSDTQSPLDCKAYSINKYKKEEGEDGREKESSWKINHRLDSEFVTRVPIT